MATAVHESVIIASQSDRTFLFIFPVSRFLAMTVLCYVNDCVTSQKTPQPSNSPLPSTFLTRKIFCTERIAKICTCWSFYLRKTSSSRNYVAPAITRLKCVLREGVRQCDVTMYVLLREQLCVCWGTRYVFVMMPPFFPFYMSTILCNTKIKDVPEWTVVGKLAAGVSSSFWRS